MQQRFAYSGLHPEKRPLVPFRIVGLPEGIKLLGLADSGSNRTYIDGRWAAELQIDLDSLERGSTGLGGGFHTTRRCQLELIVGRHSWDAEVYFVEGWSHSHMVLGLHDLFDLFIVRFDVEQELLDITPRRNTTRLKRVRR